MAQVTSDESTAVLICYRARTRRILQAGLADRLADKIGENRVFMDVDAIKPGMNFADAINRALCTCEVLLVLIGPRWLTLMDRNGRRRLDDPEDLVVVEIRTALDRGAWIIPVLVGGATMPSRDDLPLP
jgi:hypothetical protein